MYMYTVFNARMYSVAVCIVIIVDVHVHVYSF